MKVIEAVIALGLSRRLLLTGNCFLKLTFLVFGIQKPDIFQRMYVFLFQPESILSAYWKLGWPVERTVRLQASWISSDQSRRSYARYRCN